MTDPQLVSGGRRLKQLRIEHGLSQKDLAGMAGLSIKSLQRAESGHISRHTFEMLVSALELDIETQRELADEFNPLRAVIAPVVRVEVEGIRERLREELRETIEPIPAFIMDEYWFLRAMNVYLLALHQVRREVLSLRETWHPVAARFQSQLGMEKIRGINWQDYYAAQMQDFYREVRWLEKTPRYKQLMQWLKGYKGFNSQWVKARSQWDFERAQRLTQKFPISIGTGIQQWNEYERRVLVSPTIPPYKLNACLPQQQATAQMIDQILEPLNLEKRARELGYDPKREQFFFIEDFLSERDLRKIGAWVE